MRFGVFMYSEALSESPNVVIFKEAKKKNFTFSQYQQQKRKTKRKNFKFFLHQHQRF
jgi:hypothetical protein